MSNWELDRQDELQAVAEEIARKAELITTCEYHGGILSMGDSDYTSAYKIANAMIRDNDPLVSGLNLTNNQELTDAIKEFVDQTVDECYSCGKWERE